MPVALALAALLLSPAAAPLPECPSARARVSPRSTTQGGIVRLELEATPETPTATWRGKPVPFWRDSPTGPWRALLGVDLAQSPGTARVSLRGPAPPCAVSLSVAAGSFAEDRLTVPRRYVEPGRKDQARAAREAIRLAAVFRKVTPRLWQGAFSAPIEGAEPSSSFGRRRVLNGRPRSPHTGVDFASPVGTPVHATQRGRVVLDEDLFFSGRTVVLDHGLGLFSLYGHLSASRVSTGRLVEAGDVIGLVGATGRATAPHLHWAARLGDARVNALDLR